MTTYDGIEGFKKEYKDLDKGLEKEISIVRRTVFKHPTLSSAYDWVSQWLKYTLAPMPGCCGIVVSTGAWIHPFFQGKGLGDYFHKERVNLMKDLGYSCGMCTVTSENKTQIHILEKNNWKQVHSFENKRTGNIVQIWVKDL